MALVNAKEMLHYLEWYRNEYFARPEAYIAEGKYENIFDLSICRNAVLNFIEKDSFLKDIIDKMARYNVGEKVHAIVIQKQKGSLVCLVNGVDGLKGFLSEYEEKYNMSHSVYQEVVQGDEIKCEIISFDTFHGSFQLKYIDADV